MILCDGRDTRALVNDANDPHTDALAVVLDHGAAVHDRHDECWIVDGSFVEFFGRRILVSERGGRRWSHRCGTPEAVREYAARVLNVSVDDMVIG